MGVDKLHASSVGYRLAKDTHVGMSYSGPDWVPHNLWQQYEYEFGAPGANPERTRQCAQKLIFNPGAKEIWDLIAGKYDRPDNIASTLADRCAEFLDQWHATPKRTPSEHRESRLELQRRAEQLAIELERFFDRHFHGGDSKPNFTLLLSEDEQQGMLKRMQAHNHRVRNRALQDAGLTGHRFQEYLESGQSVEDARDLDWLLLLEDEAEPGIVPDLPDMLRRIGKFFAEDADPAPLQRPNGENAERNYFVRRLVRYFKHEHGSVSPTIVARVTAVFFAEGITDNEVSKQLEFLPDGRRWPLTR